MHPIEHAIAWRRLDKWGHDGCFLGRADNGWRVCGTAVFAQDGTPCQLGYALDVDPDWRTRTAHVFGTIGREVVDLAIASGADVWRVNGVAQYGTEDCELLDFSFTPALKTVTLHRLHLGQDDHANVAVAHLGVPAMRLERTEQRFRRLTPTDFLYACPKVEQSSVLRVDDHLAVVRYPARWECECATTDDESAEAARPLARELV
jgi:uncharacterized protein